jgi:fructose-specific phosphotransferase system IIB component
MAEKKFIVGVTSCIIGIAHTFMAADAMKQALEKAGCECKIETQGAQGVENEITEEDIARADAALVATDLKIKNGERFDPIPTLTVGTEEVIKNGDGIVAELLEAIE